MGVALPALAVIRHGRVVCWLLCSMCLHTTIKSIRQEVLAWLTAEATMAAVRAAASCKNCDSNSKGDCFQVSQFKQHVQPVVTDTAR